MKQKFRSLKQERRSVDEYLGEFEHLSAMLQETLKMKRRRFRPS
jgi:hypothetical protein